MSRLTPRDWKNPDNLMWKKLSWIEMRDEPFRCAISEALQKLAHYEDLEEQGRLIDWRKTSEEKPDSTRHLIVADGEIISHYGYYLKPKDKWYKTWECKEEIAEPMYWADMPDPPKESLHSDCGAKLAELKGGEA